MIFKKNMVIIVLYFNILISQKLTLWLEIERDTFCVMEPIWVKIYIKNEDNFPLEMIPLYASFGLLKLEVEEIGKGLLEYKGLLPHIIYYPTDTLYPEEIQSISLDLVHDFYNEYLNDIDKCFLHEGKYSVRAIFKVALPLKGKKSNKVHIKKILTSSKKYFTVTIPQKERKEWEEYIKAIKTKDVSYKLKFIRNYPHSRFAEDIFYSLCVGISLRARLGMESRENALKILKEMLLNYPKSRYAPSLPIRIWLLFKDYEKDKAKAILDSLISARPDGAFVENAKKIIEKYYEKGK